MSEHLAVFPGIHQTLSAEGKLKSRGVGASLVPTPPVVRSGCGFSILVAGSTESGSPGWWRDLGMPGVLYRVSAGKKGKTYEEIDRREGPGVPPAGDSVPESHRRGGAG